MSSYPVSIVSELSSQPALTTPTEAEAEILRIAAALMDRLADVSNATDGRPAQKRSA
jgi:hypothetical protein